MGGDMQVGGVQFPEHPPPTLPQPPPFPPKRIGTGAPSPLSSCPQIFPLLNTPPFPQRPPPQQQKYVKMQPSVLGIS